MSNLTHLEVQVDIVDGWGVRWNPEWVETLAIDNPDLASWFENTEPEEIMRGSITAKAKVLIEEWDEDGLRLRVTRIDA